MKRKTVFGVCDAYLETKIVVSIVPVIDDSRIQSLKEKNEDKTLYLLTCNMQYYGKSKAL